MYLENLVLDAVEPQRLGLFWETVVGGERLTDEPDAFETRLAVPGGPVLDLCFQRVPEARSEPSRLGLDLAAATPEDEVERLLALGARRIDPGDAGGVLLADPEGGTARVVQDAGTRTGPLAALRLESADPERDARFWSWLTGWTGTGPLRHPSGAGPVLELRPEAAPKGAGKSRVHLDVRLEPGEDPDAVAAAVVERGGREVQHPEWGDLPWRLYVDPSGNEFCVLPAPS